MKPIAATIIAGEVSQHIKETIYNHLVDGLFYQAKRKHRDACGAIIAFFVQLCDVFEPEVEKKMQLTNKITTFDESVISKFPPVLRALENMTLSPKSRKHSIMPISKG